VGNQRAQGWFNVAVARQSCSAYLNPAHLFSLKAPFCCSSDNLSLFGTESHVQVVLNLSRFVLIDFVPNVPHPIHLKRHRRGWSELMPHPEPRGPSWNGAPRLRQRDWAAYCSAEMAGRGPDDHYWLLLSVGRHAARLAREVWSWGSPQDRVCRTPEYIATNGSPASLLRCRHRKGI
jgi:hypothetical protein